MEINKASYKLKGLPPVYVINLDGEPHRWKEAEDMLKYWEVETGTTPVYLHMMVVKMI